MFGSIIGDSLYMPTHTHVTTKQNNIRAESLEKPKDMWKTLVECKCYTVDKYICIMSFMQISSL
mgnify:FL=1